MSLVPKIAAGLARLEVLDHKGLSAEWIKVMGAPPPKASSRKYLLRALAYQLQCKRLSGLTKGEQRQLAKHIAHAGTDASAQSKPAALTLPPGAKLLREWNGRSYTVSVIEEGFVYQDKVWPSLSAIARDITGAHWSGPRFFGLNKARANGAAP